MRRSRADSEASHSKLSRRAVLLGSAQLLFMGGLAARMRYLQVDQADQFRLLAEENRINIRLIPPSRGEIFDRNGVQLADNVPSYRIVMVREDAGDVAAVMERTWAQGGLLGAVCHGPAALVGLRNEDGTPLVQNCTLTCFTNEEEREVGLDEVMPFLLATRLEELGAKLDLADKFVSHAVADGRLITGQNPQSSQAVADALVDALYGE